MDCKILLVDDEKDIADLIEEVLRQDRFENIRKAYTGMDAVQVCREYQPDVVVLDIMLPDIDGIEVCRQIREFSFCSILFLSSKNDDIDKILGLSCGGDVTVKIGVSESELTINVSDNGGGMSNVTAERLFERYYRGTNTESKTEGTGLGLAIAKNMVELHGGTISVHSTPGVGTSFLIRFPAIKVN